MENTRATISRLAPAKLNLLLAITGARQDGFHDLVSLVAIVAGNDLADEISLTATFGDNARDTLVCDKPDLPCDDNNLVLRATKLFREQFPLRASLHWVVKKRIPSGAGLGGGSSDAATALRMLDEISRMPTTNPSSTTNPNPTTNPFATTDSVATTNPTATTMPPADFSGTEHQRRLFAIAERIGSDVPIFLLGKAALMRGRGEKIEMLSATEAAALRGRKFLVFKPAFGISTAEAYAEMRRNKPHDYVSVAEAEAQIAKWRANPMGALPQLNNMERPAFRKFLALPTLFKILREHHGLSARMSGSGSACFAEIRGDSGDGGGDILATEATIRNSLGANAFVRQVVLQ
ncbi:MAG: 4-(cytidine 5'-diphospho)-2-C-methyl-D-erythritol kinase [Opitutae bacterium]|nr:4-(cytidine 5'-diphospho)-2-C-methyl-D-erythritol kinase [Opitutae bacterium]